jgi:hypothetical protein
MINENSPIKEGLGSENRRLEAKRYYQIAKLRREAAENSATAAKFFKKYRREEANAVTNTQKAASYRGKIEKLMEKSKFYEAKINDIKANLGSAKSSKSKGMKIKIANYKKKIADLNKKSKDLEAKAAKYNQKEARYKEKSLKYFEKNKTYDVKSKELQKKADELERTQRI